MAWYDEEAAEDDDVSFEPDDWEDEITDLDQLYEFDDYDYGDYVEYEFHGTGDTG